MPCLLFLLEFKQKCEISRVGREEEEEADETLRKSEQDDVKTTCAGTIVNGGSVRCGDWGSGVLSYWPRSRVELQWISASGTMNLFNPAEDENVSMVHPEYFIISGLSGIPHIKLYYVFLFVVYVLSVLANGAVMAVICLDRRLRTPKYVAVFNLAFVDLFGSSALVPKLLDVFLLGHRRVPFRSCLTFLFFCYTCLSMQSFNLVALAYDRLLAIIFPLHYQVRMTHRFMFSLISGFWVLVAALVATATGLLTRLSYCRSVVINSYFCDHGQIYRLACNSHYPNYVVSCVYPVVIFWLPLAFILLSYAAIGCTLAKVAAVQERLKALRTCAAHLSLVAIYFIPLLITFTLMENIHPDGRIVNLSLTSVFPPLLNPVIYTLQTQEIKDALGRLVRSARRVKHAKIWTALH